MAREKKIGFDEAVELLLSERERELILEHTFADPKLTNKLDIAETRGKKIVAKYTLDDLDQLSEFVAAEANHCDNKKLQKELYALFDRIRQQLESYDDGQWPNAF